MSNDRAVFSFELNEVLSFERGQEVAEMKGISLEPDISIQPFNEYISIRGVIELKGEYQKVALQKEDTIELEDYQAKRFVEKVEELTDGRVEFTHRFPVEISVPTYRVNNLDDVSVYIDSFDYEIPDDSSLKLYSTIEIYGISEMKEAPRSKETDTYEVEEVSSQEESSDDTEKSDSVFMNHEEQEQREEPFLEDVEDTQEEEASLELEREELDFQFEFKEKGETSSEEVKSTPFTPPEIPELNQAIEEEKEEDRWKYKETKSFSEFFNKPTTEEESSSENDADLMETEEVGETDTEESTVEYEANENSDSREDPVSDVSYLSDMFRGNEEEQYTKMRLCIVQEKDTIESIAERYQITTLQLIKQNHLDDAYEVSEGQLLYIPRKR
ncbi:stage VI sporulation protein D [Oceanobacillus manasiensis]|uniref:stage VI sporulation protein D n=1 Tax=Oceanobacillus manasiensis TaxID=586413 RepID=UPI0005A8776C|nr:stage VI sporulation protein D [Oceanobacillus manasiensis]